MNKISACLVVKNEEKLIRRCLDSIFGVVDEIIVIHDGKCEDKTLSICREYNAIIKELNNFSNCNPYRPLSFDLATGDWILQIDADEFLSDNLANHLKEIINNNNFEAYEFLWPIWENGKYRTKSWPYKLCLFRKDSVSFLGLPNFVPEIKGEIKRLPYLLEHKPIKDNFSWFVFRKKLIPKAFLQANFYLKDFSEIKKFNCSLSDWPSKIRLRVKFPLFLMPLEFLVTLYKNLFSGAYREGRFGFKVAFMYGLYRILVNYYIFKLKLIKK
jgi:glycosyltransferase involved in cell wall biosynthesis